MCRYRGFKVFMIVHRGRPLEKWEKTRERPEKLKKCANRCAKAKKIWAHATMGREKMSCKDKIAQLPSSI